MFLSREEIRVRKAMDNDDPKSILNRYFTHKVSLRKQEKQEALAVWQVAVMEILKVAEAKDTARGRFKLKRLNTGSYYENAKVKEPNEFDLMLQFENYIAYPTVHDTAGFWTNHTTPPGFTTLFLSQEQQNIWRRDGCIARNGNLLSSTNVKSLFSRYVHEAISELGYSHCIQGKSSGPAVTLKITTSSKEYSIDLTLAFKYIAWPHSAQEWTTRERDWPPRQLVDEIVSDGCHLVAKRPRQASDASECFWRYSFSAAEKKLALQGDRGEPGTCHKKILRILKCLREEHKLSPLTSYHLKTIMFYEREENPDPWLWKEDQLGYRFMCAVERLLRCLLQRVCPHYFMKDVNLFDSRFDDRYVDLLSQIAGIHSNPQKYLKF